MRYKKRKKSSCYLSDYKQLGIITGVGIGILIVICIMFGSILRKDKQTMADRLKTPLVEKPNITEMFLEPNEYSRPQLPLEKVNGVVVHYTANPGTDAKSNRNYFNNLKDTKATKVSSHFVIGLDGKIIQCVPLDEVAYASNNRNSDTISIECCHPDKSGKFTDETYQSLVALTAWLCGTYNLKSDDLLRHYDITGKQCPLDYVKYPEKWENFKEDVLTYIEENKMN
ncbi:peptidoglycan recognition protein family protein [Velocimicrobium porci]|uniref:N-acetylmuramoyl-L-alanine amidase n=1 Tax=Velocimicrobium porci TaxID=2606634 RepID=A0A6L5XVL1_9FIRM|nr:peptidoglycan recognition family protein [Velocimicrobium porci]MSS62547.1 N-acetylmuramoyl-L-alanine amidase [Velocimicrobium porci]